jgi:hypothetical protein
MLEILKLILVDAEEGEADRRWAPVRRAPRGSDNALTGTARLWLRRLPPRRRPLRLCEHHPRVANRLAWCWSDPALAAQALEDLRVDRRGGRRGFAPEIVRELQRLAEFNDQQRIETRPQTLLAAAARAAGLS